MADFIDWDGAGAGGGGGGEFGGFGGGEDGGLEAGLEAPPNQKDATLFAIDCRSFMFNEVTPQQTEVAEDGTVRFIPTEGRCAFSQAVRCALQFYQHKITSNEKDYSGLMLFGCKGDRNSFGFPNVYVFQDLDVPSGPRLRETERLARVGELNASGSRYRDSEEFFNTIGHFDVTSTTTRTTPDGEGIVVKTEGAALGSGRTLPLSETLWAAQHLFRNLPKAVNTRKIMLFTLDDNPPGVSSVERDKCLARTRDLFEAQVAIEVFGTAVKPLPPGSTSLPFGSGTGMGSSAMGAIGASSGPSSGGLLGFPTTGPTTSSATASGSAPTPSLDSTSVRGGVAASPDSRSSVAGGLAPSTATAGGTSTSSGAKAAAGSLPTFDKTRFWDDLFAGASSSLFREGQDHGNGRVLLPKVSAESGEVEEPFRHLLEEVRARSWPKRTNGMLKLRIGNGANAPKLSVGVYLPIMKCKKPSFVWVEGSTNDMMTSETKHIDPSTGDEVASSDIIAEGKVGGTSVIFSTAEIPAMKAQFGSAGITILAFKPEGFVREKFAINRSSFIAPTANDENENKLFVGLHRTLVKQQKVAIAELITRTGVAPRLVALIPTKEEEEIPEVVSGLGFFVFYLPYSEDIRSGLQFQQTPATVRPAEEIIKAAEDVVENLTFKEYVYDDHGRKVLEPDGSGRKVPTRYDPTTWTNPVLEKQYHYLQTLAMQGEDDGDRTLPEDSTLPDLEGMQKYAGLMRQFTDRVYPPTYDPTQHLTATKTKPPPSADELKAIDFEGLAAADKLNSLTIVVLKEYLKSVGDENMSALKLKADYVKRVADVIRLKGKKKDSKRPREDE